MTKVLLVGGGGFIGSHVVDKLLARGHSVCVFDRQPERFRLPLPAVEYHFGDFADRMALAEALAGVDVVFHLLSTTLPGTGNLDPRVDVQHDLIGTLNLLELMDRLGVRRILFLSSGGTVYGVPDVLPIPEFTRCGPLTPTASSRFQSSITSICTYGCVVFLPLWSAPQILLDPARRILGCRRHLDLPVPNLGRGTR